jgi:ligand-binding SRPBCC domain-containing protein
MKINVQTYIKTDCQLEEVFNTFNEEMFYYLTKSAPVQNLRYDGDYVGAEIHLKILFPWKSNWVSVITDKQTSAEHCFFVDEGKTLPFNILKWKHCHIVRQSKDHVIIEDDIYFASTNWFFDLFWWLAFIPQFVLRKYQYKNYLKSKNILKAS